ncbi:hypothetical protein AVEN_20533-1 [Araneus ventricosus]|uniref:Uncharacterized protein n=1 Tax=Araneus ventricosus TaxID=182803 RepID=A0A4Y2WA71_ARAVE|nr:hypothetical protein AVEN_20533-1 [Araneus ventricosus]
MTFIRFKTKYGGLSKFHRNLRQYAHQAFEDLCNCNSKEELNKVINSIHLKPVIICKRLYRLKKQEINKPPAWWTQDLTIMKKRVGAFRKMAQRSPTELRQASCIISSRERAQYSRNLVKTRRRAGRKFCMEASNPFGKQYKAIFRAG